MLYATEVAPVRFNMGHLLINFIVGDRMLDFSSLNFVSQVPEFGGIIKLYISFHKAIGRQAS